MPTCFQWAISSFQCPKTMIWHAWRAILRRKQNAIGWASRLPMTRNKTADSPCLTIYETSAIGNRSAIEACLCRADRAWCRGFPYSWINKLPEKNLYSSIYWSIIYYFWKIHTIAFASLAYLKRQPFFAPNTHCILMFYNALSIRWLYNPRQIMR